MSVLDRLRHGGRDASYLFRFLTREASWPANVKLVFDEAACVMKFTDEFRAI
jgi:hypothetical protein